jgi:hypothetical protein
MQKENITCNEFENEYEWYLSLTLHLIFLSLNFTSLTLSKFCIYLFILIFAIDEYFDDKNK